MTEGLVTNIDLSGKKNHNDCLFVLNFVPHIKLSLPSGNMAERLRHRSYDQKVPSSIPRSGISVEVSSQC